MSIYLVICVVGLVGNAIMIGMQLCEYEGRAIGWIIAELWCISAMLQHVN